MLSSTRYPGLLVLAALLPILIAVLTAGAVPTEHPDPAAVRDEFEIRLARLAADDHAGAVALGRWAVEHGLLDAADAVYRRTLRRDRDHVDAYWALRHLAENRELPTESDALARARASLPDGTDFATHETRHFVILSDGDPTWVRTLGDVLERAVRRFDRFAMALDLRPLPVRHKLVAIAFADRERFLAFSKAGVGRELRTAAGYYNPNADRLVVFDVASERSFASAHGELESMFAAAESVRRAARAARNRGQRGRAADLDGQVEARFAQLDENERRLARFAYRWSVSVTIHEAIHQLTFHTEVFPAHVQPPLWLAEGLATAFETDDPARPFGPFDDYATRREGFWRLQDAGRVLPLDRLLALTASEASDALYDQSYAFVTWLCTARKAELRDYLRRLHGALRGDAPGVASAFDAAFGSRERLEEAWRRAEQLE